VGKNRIMNAIESGVFLYISAVEALALIIAFFLVILAYRGYKKSSSKSLLAAAVGFGIVGVASLTEGLLYDVLGFSLLEAQAFRSTLTAIGLIVLLYSVYRTR